MIAVVVVFCGSPFLPFFFFFFFFCCCLAIVAVHAAADVLEKRFAELPCKFFKALSFDLFLYETKKRRNRNIFLFTRLHHTDCLFVGNKLLTLFAIVLPAFVFCSCTCRCCMLYSNYLTLLCVYCAIRSS